MKTRYAVRTGLALVIVLFAAGVTVFLLVRPVSMPLTIVSSGPDVRVVSIICTFGTNHVYYYGDGMDQIMDPITTRLGDTNAYRLRCATDQPSTVVWVRFTHLDYGVIPPRTSPAMPPIIPPRFRASLTEGSGATTNLELESTLQHFRRQFYVAAWALPGPLDAHQGGTIRIEFTKGTEAVTLRIP
jgi:hypothetical protein